MAEAASGGSDKGKGPALERPYAPFAGYRLAVRPQVESLTGFFAEWYKNVERPGTHTLEALRQAERYSPGLSGEVTGILRGSPVLTGGIEYFFEFMEQHSPETYAHVMRVTSLTAHLAEKWNEGGKPPCLSPEEKAELCLAALTHDFGKLLIPGEILHADRKASMNDRLSADEWNAIEKKMAEQPLRAEEKSSFRQTIASLRGLPLPPSQGKELFMGNLIALAHMRKDGTPVLSDTEIHKIENYSQLIGDNWEIMRHHAQLSYDILEKLSRIDKNPLLNNLARIAASHHLNADGTGYPKGLNDTPLTIQTQLLTAADHYEALIAERSYKRSVTDGEAKADLRKGAEKGEINEDILALVEENIFKGFRRSYANQKASKVGMPPL